ncbi:MAG: hypothetical protein ACRBBP_10640 [Bdellovibrionales bacterium]
MIYSILISFVLAFTSPTGLIFSAQAKPAKNASSKKKAKKIDKLDLSLRIFGAAKNRWVLHKVLKKGLSKEDSAFLRTKSRQFKVKLKKSLNIKYLSAKRAFSIEGYSSLFYVSKNGKALKHQNKIFTIQKGKDLKAKLKYIQETLKASAPKKFSLLDLLITKAHAQGPYEGTSNSASLDILMLLSYLEVYGNGDSFYDVLLYAAENEPAVYEAIRRLFESNGRKAISGITCDNDYRMTINFSDGSFSALNWNGVQGSGAKAELNDNINGNWNPVKFYYDEENEHSLNAQYFFCDMMGGSDTANGAAVITSLNDMIAPVDYADESVDGYPSESLE